MLRGVECDSPVNPLRCAQLGSAKLPKPAARVRIGSCRNEFHEIQNHPSEMVLRGRDSVPAAALSGSLFLKPPALPEDIYCRPQGDAPGGGCASVFRHASIRSPHRGWCESRVCDRRGQPCCANDKCERLRHWSPGQNACARHGRGSSSELLPGPRSGKGTPAERTLAA